MNGSTRSSAKTPRRPRNSDKYSQLLEYFPSLERAFDYAHRKGALILLTGYQTPEALRRIGRTRLDVASVLIQSRLDRSV